MSGLCFACRFLFLLVHGFWLVEMVSLCWFLKGYGVEGGAFCGVFDGHGKNGHIVSKMVRNRLPSLVLGQKNMISKTKPNQGGENGDESPPSDEFCKWKEACISAFKVMDKEVKLQESLDCSCSGTTAVVVIKQVIINKFSLN